MRKFGEAKEVCRCGLCDAPMGKKQIALRLTGMNVCGSCFDKMMCGESESQNGQKENVQKEKEQSLDELLQAVAEALV